MSEASIDNLSAGAGVVVGEAVEVLGAADVADASEEVTAGELVGADETAAVNVPTMVMSVLGTGDRSGEEAADVAVFADWVEVVGTTVDEARAADVEALATPEDDPATLDADAPAKVDSAGLADAAIDEDPDGTAVGCTVTVTSTVVCTVTTGMSERTALVVLVSSVDVATGDDVESSDALGTAVAVADASEDVTESLTETAAPFAAKR